MNQINSLEKQESIKSVHELDNIIKRYNDIKQMTKLDFEDNRSEFETLRKLLLTGIPFKKNNVIDLIIQKILLFLVENGYSYEKYDEVINSTIFKISSIKTLTNSQGLAYSVGKNIVLDKSLAQFDEKGLLKGLNEKEKEFLIYIITHELFHRISSFKKEKNSINIANSAISEGITEYLTELTTNYNGKNKSKTYEFIKNIIKILTDIIGIDKLLSDYLDNLGTYPNLTYLFLLNGLDFKKFETLMDDTLNKRYEHANINNIKAIETQILLELKERIIIPYIRTNPEQSSKIINDFNCLFKEYNIVLNIDVITSNQKNNNKKGK